jgi:hypothetical protein
MAQKARPGSSGLEDSSNTGRGFSTPPGNARVPPGSRLGSPRKRFVQPPETEGHGNMTRSGQERTRVDYETR